jgi:lambda family phage portal protein
MDWVPGMMFDDLQPGEEIGTINPNRPNNALIPFRDSQLRSASSGLGCSNSSLSKNYNGTYSAQRQELVEQRVHYGALSGVFIRRFCMPVWYGFIDSILAARAIDLPREVNRNTLYNATHVPPPMPWIDPKKEAEANEIMEKRGYKSRSRIIRERGDNPDQVNRELIRDKQEAERLGLDFSDKPAAQQVQPAQPLETEE